MNDGCEICKARAEADRADDARVRRLAETIAVRLLTLRAELTINLETNFRDRVIAEVNRRITR